MKLYSVNLSPYASRARIAVLAKGLPVEISYPPPGGLKSPEYLAITPLGKIPCFVTDDGTCVPESAVIVELLEDMFPEPALRPADPLARARGRMLSAIADNYITAATVALAPHRKPETRDQAVVDAQLAKLDQALSWVDHYLTGADFALGDSLSTADCMLAPSLAGLPVTLGLFGRPEVLTRHAKVARYLETVVQHPVVAKVLGEQGAAFKLYIETGKIS